MNNDIAALLESRPELRPSYQEACDRVLKARARATRTEDDRKLKGGLLRVASLRGDPQAKAKLRKEFEAAEREEREAREELEVAEALYADAESRRAAYLEIERQKKQGVNFLELIEAVRDVDARLLPSLHDGLQRVEVAKRTVLALCTPAEDSKTRELFVQLDLRFAPALATHLFEFPQVVPLRHLKLEWNDSPEWGAALQKKTRAAPSAAEAPAENSPSEKFSDFSPAA
jgi:hypothetical protein